MIPILSFVLAHALRQTQADSLKYMWWWNNERLHGELDMRTPAEVEAAYYADTEPVPELIR